MDKIILYTAIFYLIGFVISFFINLKMLISDAKRFYDKKLKLNKVGELILLTIASWFYVWFYITDQDYEIDISKFFKDKE